MGHQPRRGHAPRAARRRGRLVGAAPLWLPSAVVAGVGEEQRLQLKQARFVKLKALPTVHFAATAAAATTKATTLPHPPTPVAPAPARCVYDDIYLAIRKLRAASGGLVRQCMVIDLDVHQGNGVERDKLRFADADTFILDVYHGTNYPMDHQAKQARWLAAPGPRLGVGGGAGMRRRLLGALVRSAIEAQAAAGDTCMAQGVCPRRR